MNKNIKFINLNNESKIKIICYHSNELINLEDPIDPNDYKNKFKIDYALASNNNFFIVLNRLFNKIISNYNNNEIFTININTMINNFNKKSDVLYKIPFKSIKDIFINSVEFNLEIIQNEKNFTFNSTFKAFTRTSSKDILEHIINFSFIDYDTINIHFKIGKHLYNNKKYTPDLNLHNLNITYRINNFKECTLSNILSYIIDPIYNITKLLDYKTRDKKEKELYENMESHIVFNVEKDNLKLIKNIEKYNKNTNNYTNYKEEKLNKDILDSHEVFKQEYFDSNINGNKDLLAISFSPIHKEKILEMKINSDQLLINLAEFYGINRQPLYKNNNINKYIGTIITKCINIIKLKNSDNFPMKYKVLLGVDIKNNILNFEISLNTPKYIKEILLGTFNKVVTDFSTNVLIDLNPFFNLKNSNDKELLRLLDMITNIGINKEIKNTINDIIKENSNINIDLNKNTNELTNIILNKNVLYKFLCNVYKISELLKVVI